MNGPWMNLQIKLENSIEKIQCLKALLLAQYNLDFNWRASQLRSWVNTFFDLTKGKLTAASRPQRNMKEKSWAIKNWPIWPTNAFLQTIYGWDLNSELRTSTVFDGKKVVWKTLFLSSIQAMAWIMDHSKIGLYSTISLLFR